MVIAVMPTTLIAPPSIQAATIVKNLENDILTARTKLGNPSQILPFRPINSNSAADVRRSNVVHNAGGHLSIRISI